MLEPLNVLHVGAIEFPIPWEDWYAGVGKVLGVQIGCKNQDHLSAQDLVSHFKKFDFIRLSPGWSTEASHLFPASAPLINRLHYVDLIFRKNKTLWPYLLHKDAIHSVIIDKQPCLNIKGSGLIVGYGPESILAVHVLADLGFKHITVVVEKDIDAQALLSLFRGSLFDVKFEIITRDKIILLPGIFSVVIVYSDLHKEIDLLTALLYFNYLERGGLVINAGFQCPEVPLLEESAAIGAKVVDVNEVQLHHELMAFRKILPLPREILKRMASLIST